MKNYFCFYKVVWSLIFLFLCHTSYSQSPWDAMNLTGESFKIISVPVYHRYTVSFHTKVPFGSTQSLFVSSKELQNLINTPPLFLDLLEKLEGKFYMGDNPGQTTEDVELKGTTPKLLFGLGAGKSIGRHLEIQGGVGLLSHSWEGSFPVTVIPFQQTEPRVVKGTIEASSRYTLINLGAAWFVRRKIIQPFVVVGMNVSVPGKTSLKARLSGFNLPITKFEKSSALYVNGGLGARVIIRKYFFAEVSSHISKLPSQKYAPLLQISVGGGI